MAQNYLSLTTIVILYVDAVALFALCVNPIRAKAFGLSYPSSALFLNEHIWHYAFGPKYCPEQSVSHTQLSFFVVLL